MSCFLACLSCVLSYSCLGQWLFRFSVTPCWMHIMQHGMEKWGIFHIRMGEFPAFRCTFSHKIVSKTSTKFRGWHPRIRPPLWEVVTASYTPLSMYSMDNHLDHFFWAISVFVFHSFFILFLIHCGRLSYLVHYKLLVSYAIMQMSMCKVQKWKCVRLRHRTWPIRSEAQLHDFTQEETITAEVETPHFSYCHGSNRKSKTQH